ncbi:MAG: glutathione binding-like protein [Paracoccus sp. (in: a-proteobacteria)]
MFWEQNQHEGTVAVRAALNTYPQRRHLVTPERMADLLERGHALLQIMEDRLSAHDWLAGDGITLADICLYGYTHRAGELGGFDMSRFPGINAWLARISGLPGYKGLSE